MLERVEVEPVRNEAVRTEAVAVKAIEAAIQAWQDSSTVKVALTKARQEAAEAGDVLKQAVDQQTKARDESVQTSNALDAAKRKCTVDAETTAEATENKENAIEAVELAEKAVVKAEAEVAKAEQVINSLQEVVRFEAVNLKQAKKSAHDAATVKEETERADHLANSSLQQAEKNLMAREAGAEKASKKLYAIREESDEATRAFETASAAAEEFKGQGGEWEKRTQSTLKEREAEFKRVERLLAKAEAGEAAAEEAFDDAQTKVLAAKEDVELKKQEAAEAAEAHENMVKLLADQQALYDHAESEASLAVQNHAIAESQLKNAKASAAATTVTKLEEIAAAAMVEEKMSHEKVAELVEKSAIAKELVGKAGVERERVQAIFDEKRAHAEKIAEREHEALDKEKRVVELLADLEEKVHALACLTYESRMGAPAWWTREEAEATAEAARQIRRGTASLDVRTVASGVKTAHLDVTPFDKWKLFKKWGDENWSSIDMWNAHRAFFNRDGEVLSGINMMVADIVGDSLDRGPPDPTQCRVIGAGLTSASIAEKASFTILACSSHGIRFEDGGDKFTVKIRFAGQCERVTAKIVDNDDGSYEVTYVPRSTGVCTISVTFEGEPLPGSPFSCVVAGREGPAPCASRCMVSGDSLGKVVAHTPEHFFISFRDSNGRVAHASELDVWVQPVDPTSVSADDTAEAVQADLEGFPLEVAQLLAPPGAFDSFVVGANALDVSRTPDPSSVRIARLPPGRTLKLGKVEPPTEGGTIRALVRLELEDLESKQSSTWRSLWPQQQPWRSLSWRAHRVAEIKREDEEAEAMAIAHAMHLEAKRLEAACLIEAVYRGKESRKHTNRLHQKRRAAIEAATRAAEGIIVPEAQSVPVGRGKKSAAGSPEEKRGRRGGAAASKGKETSPAKGDKRSTETALPPAPATSAKQEPKEQKPSADVAEGKVSGDGKVAKSEKKTGGEESKPKKQAAKEKKSKKFKAADAEAEEAAAAAVVVDESMTVAAMRIQKIARGRAARKQAKATDAAAATGGAPTKAAANTKAKGSKKGTKKDTSRKARESTKSASTSRDAQGTGRVASPDAVEKRTKIVTARGTPSPRLRAPSPPLNLNAQPLEQMYGWVTLAAGGECNVVKQTGRLPIKLRTQHEQHWMRRNAIDSERERERAKQRDATLDNDKGLPHFNGATIPHDHQQLAASSPRPAYWDDVAFDPKRIGFAYGGVFPGRLHAKGQLVETHQVSFSIGVTGNYLLYVNLRQPHTPWASTQGGSPIGEGSDWTVPGSPFKLQVSPGNPYPLTTTIPMEKQPLKGIAETGADGKQVHAVHYIMQALDKMGNMCDSGGAEVTCGFQQAKDSVSSAPTSSRATSARATSARATSARATSARATSSRPPPVPASDVSDPKAEPTGEETVASATAAETETQHTKVIDKGDGTYELQWFAASPGTFDFWVKLDGIHILGSPGKLHVSAPPKEQMNKPVPPAALAKQPTRRAMVFADNASPAPAVAAERRSAYERRPSHGSTSDA